MVGDALAVVDCLQDFQQPVHIDTVGHTGKLLAIPWVISLPARQTNREQVVQPALVPRDQVGKRHFLTFFRCPEPSRIVRCRQFGKKQGHFFPAAILGFHQSRDRRTALFRQPAFSVIHSLLFQPADSH